MARKKRNKEQLQGASNHLYYEVWMLEVLTQALASGLAGEGPMNNALLESFTIHARALLDFLYTPEKLREDDVIAEDFFDDPAQWVSIRPVKTTILQTVHHRVGKEIAHLTYARQEVAPEMKAWPFAQIGKEIISICSLFLKSISRNLLGERWNAVDLKNEAVKM
jgi:hypothetical protein